MSSNLYATIQPDKRSPRTSTANRTVRVAAQSYEGSVTVEIQARGPNDPDALVTIGVADGSSHEPDRILWSGSLADLMNTARTLSER